MMLSARVLGGRYRLGGLLGRGGMAEVYEGWDERLDRPVAVKLLRPDMAADPLLRNRFEVEARAAARLSHPNVVAVFDTGEDDGTPFIVMEQLPGETLADIMVAGPVDQEWLRRLTRDVLAALAAAHTAGIVHRDVKPGNILISHDGSAKVADFGIAKAVEGVVGDTTATGVLLGTPAYLAPERLDGQPATPQSDLYSLGVVLYEALAGVKPFTGATPLAVADAIMRSEPVPLAEARPGVDPVLAGVVEQALAKDPALRPPSALEMAAALGVAPAEATAAVPGGEGDADATVVDVAPPARAGHDSLAAVVRSWRSAGWALLRRRPRLAAAGVGALVVLLLVVLITAAGGSRPRSDGTLDRAELAGRLRGLADQVDERDGEMGREASRRLEVVADHVAAGGGGHEATALLRDAAEWARRRLLSGPVMAQIAALLGDVPGVDATVVVPTVPPTTAATTTTEAEPAEDGKDGKDGDEGRGKGGKKKDD